MLILMHVFERLTASTLHYLCVYKNVSLTSILCALLVIDCGSESFELETTYMIHFFIEYQ